MAKSEVTARKESVKRKCEKKIRNGEGKEGRKEGMMKDKRLKF